MGSGVRGHDLIGPEPDRVPVGQCSSPSSIPGSTKSHTSIIFHSWVLLNIWHTVLVLLFPSLQFTQPSFTLQLCTT